MLSFKRSSSLEVISLFYIFGVLSADTMNGNISDSLD